MSSPIVVPFNFDPIETSIKTANYTIPAGRYARVTPLSIFCTIDGVSFEEPDNFFTWNTTGGVAAHKIPRAGDFRIKSNNVSATKNLHSVGSSSAATQRIVHNVTTTNVFDVVFKEAIPVSVTRLVGVPSSGVEVPETGAHYAISLTNFVLFTINKFILEACFVPAGTILSGTAQKWLVEEYNKIT